jgi:serine/threonine-protein kinase
MLAMPMTTAATAPVSMPAMPMPPPAPVPDVVTAPAPAAQPLPSVRPERSPVLLTVGALIAGALIGGAGVWQFWRPATGAGASAGASGGVVHTSLPLAPADELNSGGAYAGIGGARTALAFSPDGNTLAFVGRQAGGRPKILIRDLSAGTTRALDGTEGAENPTFSPDGREIAFSSAREIRRTPVAGGPVTKICEASTWVNGISWGESRLVFGNNGTLMQVMLESGQVERLIENKSDATRHASPRLLPDDRAVLFTEHQKRWTSGDERVMVKRLPDGAPTLLVPDAADARLLPNGKLAFLRQGTLFVADFDADALTLTGALPRAVVKDVAQVVMSGTAQDLSLAGQFAVSSTGALAYVAIPLVTRPDTEMVAIDRKGQVTPLGGGPNTYQAGAALSRDGARIAVSLTTNQERRPFAFDVTRGTLTPLTPSGKAEFVGRVWSPVDNRVAFLAFEKGAGQFVVLNADDPSAVARLPGTEEFWPNAWSADGKRLAGTSQGGVAIYEPGASPAFRRFNTAAAGEVFETHPGWSLDGKWLAYASSTTGRPEVYVRPYPGPGREIRISTNGGNALSWSRDGRELYYIAPDVSKEGDRAMMAVNMTNPAKPGPPVRLFPFFNNTLRLACNPANCYAVGTGSRLFIGTREVTQPVRPVQSLNLILNWVGSLGR